MTELAAPFQSGGTDDLTYIRAFREDMRDMPKLYSEQFSGTGTVTNFQCQKAPINDDLWLQITVGGAVQTYTFQYSQLSNYNCYVDLDTGVIVFQTAPPSGVNNVVVQKRTVRWRDGVILRSLYEGLKRCFPSLWTINIDTSITLAVNTWDYQLPSMFGDPRVKILSVARQDIPYTVNPFVEDIAWSRVGLGTLHIPFANSYTRGTQLRLEYAGPYQSLSDLEPQASELPLLYAKGMLLGNDEARRTRMDTTSAVAESGANQPGQAQNAAQWFLAQYDRKLAALKRPMRMGGWRSTYTR